MSDSMELQDISNVIESILCQFDAERENNFTDRMALQLLALAFDKYHFKDLDLRFCDATSEFLFERMLKIIEKDLHDIPKDEIVKVLASIYRSIQRRTSGDREYLSFIHEYVGTRVKSGMRILQI